jgi:hypothetical protein
MRLGGVGLLVAIFALTGCKGLTSKPLDKKDKERDATAVSRPRGAGPAWLEEGTARVPGSTGGIPGPDRRGLLAGRVLDPFGKGARNVFIRIEPADATPREKDGAALGILTDDAGNFLVKELPIGRTYVLTVEAKSDGKPLIGVVQTRPPQANITIALRDDLGLPGGSETSLPPRSSTTGLPEGDRIPAMGLPPPAPANRVGEGDWAPGAGSAAGSIPASIPGISPGGSGTGGVPPPASIIPTDPRPSVRPESTAGSDAPWRPPTVSIPGSPPVQSLPLPPPGVSTPDLPGKKSSLPLKGRNFALVDTLDRPWDFAANHSGSLVLLSFTTTNCVYCKETNQRVLVPLQSKYASAGLQLIGVLCDDGSQSQRAIRAARYQRDQNLNFAVYVEPGATAGAVRDRFDVEAYPTAVLLNGDGAVIWQGHPGKRDQLEAAIRKQLGK